MMIVIIDKVDENKQDDNKEQVYCYLEDKEKEEEKVKEDENKLEN